MEYNGFETWGERRKMKVFISWSGKTSFEVAKVLKVDSLCNTRYRTIFLFR